MISNHRVYHAGRVHPLIRAVIDEFLRSGEAELERPRQQLVNF